MSQFPIENLNVNQGDSVFENLYITDRFFYDFSEDNIKAKNLVTDGYLSVGSTATFSSNVSNPGSSSMILCSLSPFQKL